MTPINLRITFAKNLADILESRNKKPADLVKDLKLKQPTVSSWINGEKYPRIDKMQLLAEYFNCEIADLVGPQAEAMSKIFTKRTTNIEERYEYFIEELSLRDADFYFEGKKLTDDELDILKSMLANYMDMFRSIIKTKRAK